MCAFERSKKGMKFFMKKIALVADVKDWAFDIAAQIIKRALSDKYQIDIYYTKAEEFKKDLFKILETIKD